MNDDDLHRSETIAAAGLKHNNAKPRSTEALVIERSRLLPRISFRTLFALTFLGALVASLGRAAGLGESGGLAILASGLIAGIVFLASVSATLFVVFILGWLVALLTHTSQSEDQFADNEMPPQWVAPRDPAL